MSDEGWNPSLGLTKTTAPLVMDALAAIEGETLSPLGSDIRDVALAVVEDVFGAAIKELGSSVEEVLTDALSTVLDDALGIVADVAGIVPVVGAVIGIVISVIKAVAAADAAEEQANARGCAASTRRPVTFHWASRIYPADIFVEDEYDLFQLLENGGVNYTDMTIVSGNRIRMGTLLGETLIAATEPPYVPATDPAYHLCPDDTEYAKILTNWKNGYRFWADSKGYFKKGNEKKAAYFDKVYNNVGFSPKRRRMYRNLSTRMRQRSWEFYE